MQREYANDDPTPLFQQLVDRTHQNCPRADKIRATFLVTTQFC